MRHTLIRRFTADTNKLRRRDADGEDPDERLVPVDGPLAAVDVPTDASQYTQEKRATPGQEDFGILKPMRLPNGSYPPNSFGLLLSGSLCHQQTLDSESTAFHPISATFHNPSLLSQLISTTALSSAVTSSRHHSETGSLFHLRSRSVCIGYGFGREERERRGDTAFTWRPTRCPLEAIQGGRFYDTSFYCKYSGTVHILERGGIVLVME